MVQTANSAKFNVDGFQIAQNGVIGFVALPLAPSLLLLFEFRDAGMLMHGNSVMQL